MREGGAAFPPWPEARSFRAAALMTIFRRNIQSRPTRRRVHSRPLRLFLIGMLAVPLCRCSRWGFAASITVSAASRTRRTTRAARRPMPGCTGWWSQLPQDVRNLRLAAERPASTAGAPGRRAETRRHVGAPGQDRARRDRGNTQPGAWRTDRRPGTDPRDPPGCRRRHDEPVCGVPAYSDIVDEVFRYFISTVNERSGAALGGVSVGAVDGAYALEMASREAALIDGTVSVGGRLTPHIRELFAGAAAERHELLARPRRWSQPTCTPATSTTLLPTGSSRPWRPRY